MKQSGTQKPELPGQKPDGGLVQGQWFDQEKHIFQRGKAKGYGNQKDRPIDRFMDIFAFIQNDYHGQEFRQFFDAGPADNL